MKCIQKTIFGDCREPIEVDEFKNIKKKLDKFNCKY